LQALTAALQIRQAHHQQQHEQQQQQQDGAVSKNKHCLGKDSSSSSFLGEEDPILVLVSTLHNIANVHQEAGQLSQALQVLVQAKDVLWKDVNDTEDDDGDGGDNDKDKKRRNIYLRPGVRHGGERQRRHRHPQRWHQSARLCTAMGHVYYQAEHWKDAKEAYHDALEIYERLIRPHDDNENEEQQDLLIEELLNVRADIYELNERQQQQEQEQHILFMLRQQEEEEQQQHQQQQEEEGKLEEQQLQLIDDDPRDTGCYVYHNHNKYSNKTIPLH
jgi:hypothetical protein